VLFDHTAVSTSARDALPSDVVRLVVVNNGLALAHPCGAHSDAGCRVYNERPDACRAFVCMLGRALAEGETSLADAQILVRQAQELVAQVEPRLPVPGAFERLRSVYQRARQQAEVDEEGSTFAPLVVFLRRHFLGRHAA
jgi:Fe-S-cluster containining protein